MIVLNGEPAEIEAGARLPCALACLGVEADARGIAVAVDGAVVPRSDWARVELREGARVEVLAAMQGG